MTSNLLPLFKRLTSNVKLPIKQKSQQLEVAGFLIETKPQEPLLAVLLFGLLCNRLVVLRDI